MSTPSPSQSPTTGKGREIATDEGEVLAAFDGPARAIRCAIAVKEAAERQNVELGIGLHTGECDVVGDKYGGVAVDLARHVCSTSNDGNIIVSRTVKELGCRFGFEI